MINAVLFAFFVADMDLATITDRMEVKRAIQSGNVQEAIEKMNDLNPTVRFCFCFLPIFSLCLDLGLSENSAVLGTLLYACTMC